MTLTEERAQSYAAQIGLLMLLGAHQQGLRILRDSYGQDLPAPVVAAMNDHVQSVDRLIETIDAVVVG